MNKQLFKNIIIESKRLKLFKKILYESEIEEDQISTYKQKQAAEAYEKSQTNENDVVGHKVDITIGSGPKVPYKQFKDYLNDQLGNR
jgi:hypothetical protein